MWQRATWNCNNDNFLNSWQGGILHIVWVLFKFNITSEKQLAQLYSACRDSRYMEFLGTNASVVGYAQIVFARWIPLIRSKNKTTDDRINEVNIRFIFPCFSLAQSVPRDLQKLPTNNGLLVYISVQHWILSCFKWPFLLDLSLEINDRPILTLSDCLFHWQSSSGHLQDKFGSFVSSMFEIF